MAKNNSEAGVGNEKGSCDLNFDIGIGLYTANHLVLVKKIK